MREPILPWELQRRIDEIRVRSAGFDTLKDHVIITTPGGTIIYANPAVERLTGFSVEECLGKNPADLWGGKKMPPETYQRMWRTIKEEKRPFVGEARNGTKSGKEVWQELHITPVLGADDEILYFIGVQPDITERKHQGALREEFIAVLGHQLKNPLASSKLALELLAADRALTDEQQEAVRSAHQSTETLINTVCDLLTLAHIESIAHKRTSAVSLTVELQKFLAEIRVRHPSVALTFDGTIDARVAADPILLSHLFINLLSNAVEYADAERGEVSVVLREEDGTYICSIANDGLSIPREMQPSIFSKFFRTSDAQSRKKSGTGLGLYIVKMIADRLGWGVSFESPRPSKSDGTVFHVRMPRA